MAKLNILPCPFCGGRAKCEKRNSGYQVRCQECGSRGKYAVVHSVFDLDTPKETAIAAWNRRESELNG